MSISPLNNISMKSYSMNQKPTKRQVIVAASSALVPGLGQVLNEDFGKGLLFFTSGLGLAYLTKICRNRNLKFLQIIPKIALALVCMYSALEAAFNTKP